MGSSKRIRALWIAALCAATVACAGRREPATQPENSRPPTPNGPPAQIERTDPPVYRPLPQGTYKPDSLPKFESSGETREDAEEREWFLLESDVVGDGTDDQDGDDTEGSGEDR